MTRTRALWHRCPAGLRWFGLLLPVTLITQAMYHFGGLVAVLIYSVVLMTVIVTYGRCRLPAKRA